ncbi:MAG: exodeoxyribonuclease VII small subunit [Clostridiales Family XIII bacterium]|jgi:exodeoxyribonuclease VII small subunit|nr:exodeoxyribonuclease VII small subunit [Clostridiales Family XIII bacterium]
MAERKRRSDVEKNENKMPADESALSFEDALAGLERSVDALKGDGATLENVVKSFEEGMRFYSRCEAILNETKQKIEVYGKDVL